MTTGKTIAWTRWTFVDKVMSLLFNVLSRFVITFLLRSKHLLNSWLQEPSAVILEPRKIKSATVSTVSHLFAKVSRRIKIIKIKAETNEKEMKETIAKINKTKTWFLENIHKIEKPLARLIKKEREKNQINKIRSETWEITTDNTEIQRIMRLLSATICQQNGTSWEKWTNS